MNAPPAKERPNSHPLRLIEGIAEKKDPKVHPIASPAPQPINTPPKIDWKNLNFSLGILILNSPASDEAKKDPGMMPHVAANEFEI